MKVVSGSGKVLLEVKEIVSVEWWDRSREKRGVKLSWGGNVQGAVRRIGLLHRKSSLGAMGRMLRELLMGIGEMFRR